MESLMTVGMIGLLLLIAVIDYRKKEIARKVLILMILLVGVNYLLYQPISIQSSLGGLMLGIVLLLLSVITKEKIGKGDAYLIMVLGGYLGISRISLVLLYALTLCAILSGLLLICKKVKREYRVAFVPFIFVGFIGVLCNGI
ncbi:prepilin peptidase [Anaerosporobacter faecicola]|uniref:prepilin peptidase n=1 Tax=Anaerosporobacter faecicola TaxID=2718714 RepID=UPI0014395EDE|nr:prepilin peptidase [Anaerosporobacter faecicola]